MVTPLFHDIEGGNDNNDGSTYSNRVKTFTRLSTLADAAIKTDDVQCRMMASLSPNSLGINAEFSYGTNRIVLASALTTTLSLGQAAWTASSNVTSTTSTSVRKLGATALQIDIGSSFTTGKAAYVALGGTVNLSSRQQVSFWIYQGSGTLAANLSLRVCSDSTGDVSVNRFDIPALAATSQWHRFTIDLGSAMTSSAQSLALYVDSDQGAQQIFLQDIIACNAPGTGELTLTTLIGSDNSDGAGGTGEDGWYPIRWISGTDVYLETFNSSSPNNIPWWSAGYFGASRTAAAYSVSPQYFALTTTSSDAIFTACGTATHRLTLSGGWDRAAMSSQSGRTRLAFRSSGSIGQYIQSAYIDIERYSVYLAQGVNNFILVDANIDFRFAGPASSVVIAGGDISGEVHGTQFITFSISGVGHDLDVAAYSLNNATLNLVNCTRSNVRLSGTILNVTSGPNQIADAVLRRNMANVQESDDGDGLSIHSLYGSHQMAETFNRSTGVVKHPDGTTLHTFTVTTNDALEPVERLS